MTNEEISVGVKILLERSKTNPDEMREEYGQWASLREAVFNYMERGERSAWIRGLTDHEIALLFDMFSALCRSMFDAWVMKNVLGAGEEEEDAKVAMQRKMVHTQALNNIAIKNPSTFSMHHNTLQNATPPGSWQTVTTDNTYGTSLVSRLKQELGIK